MTTTENATLFLDCSALVTAALLLFVPGNAFRDKGPAGHDERIQRPPASRFRFAKDGDVITDLSGQSGQAGIDRTDELQQQVLRAKLERRPDALDVFAEGFLSMIRSKK
jgi:hypothetical protein